MSTPIRFINWTTKLPIDDEIELQFNKTINSAYREAVEKRRCRRHSDQHIDVFFVDEYDPDLKDPIRKQCVDKRDDIRSEMQIDPDWLGVYFGFHSEFNRSIIKVCPERVMACALAFTGSRPLPLIRRYPLLLVAVIIHELAHWLMDEEYEPAMDICTWKWLIENRLAKDPSYPYLKGHRSHLHQSRTTSQPQASIRHFIEESLAEAFILKQQVTGNELDFLREFTLAAPSGYSSGVCWSGSQTEMQKTALNWARFKEFRLCHSRWDFVFAAGATPLDALIDRLKQGDSIAVFDFEREFIHHLANQVASWQVAYHSDKSTWGDRLYEIFGVYWSLVHSQHLRAPARLKFLKQWAASGTPEAIDELHKTCAKTAKTKGNFKKALKHQDARLLLLPKLRHNDYWHTRILAEINTEISDLHQKLGQNPV